jgi:hypothetical protein
MAMNSQGPNEFGYYVFSWVGGRLDV